MMEQARRLFNSTASRFSKHTLRFFRPKRPVRQLRAGRLAFRTSGNYSNPAGTSASLLLVDFPIPINNNTPTMDTKTKMNVYSTNVEPFLFFRWLTRGVFMIDD
jgi:hypothetical protein